MISKKDIFMTLLCTAVTVISVNSVKSSVLVPVEITKANFSKEITDYKKPVVLIAVSDKNDVCKMLDPIYPELIEKLGGQGKVAMMNIEKNPEQAKECGVINTPTVLFYNNGKLFGKLEINAQKDDCKALVKYIIGLSSFTCLGYYNFLISLLKKI